MTRTSGELPQKIHNDDRIRRANSWLARGRTAESDRKVSRTAEDKDGLYCEQFIFLWIAFNAAYGRELIGDDTDRDGATAIAAREQFSRFLRDVLERDQTGALSRILWHTHSTRIRKLLANKYVFGPFWLWARDLRGDDWKAEFRRRNRRVEGALNNRRPAEHNVSHVLEEVFNRLYVLRNQVFHGGATYASEWGKDQVQDGCLVMASLVPVIVNIMRDDIEKNPDTDTWGRVSYPHINEGPDMQAVNRWQR